MTAALLIVGWTVAVMIALALFDVWYCGYSSLFDCVRRAIKSLSLMP